MQIFNIKKFNNIFFIIIFLSIWISLDTSIQNIKFDSFLNILIFLRTIFPYFGIFLIIANIKKLKKINLKNYFFLLIFLFQIPGFVTTNNSILNLEYLLTSFIFFLMLSFAEVEDLKIQHFINISLIMLLLIIIFYGSSLLFWYFFLTDQLNLYGSWPHALENVNFLTNNVPRSSGIARTAFVLFMISSIYLIAKKNYFFSLTLNIFLTLLIILCQSRVIFLAYCIFLLFIFILIFFQNIKRKTKFFIILKIIILPLLFSVIIINSKTYISNYILVTIDSAKLNNHILKEKQKHIRDGSNILRPLNDKNVGFGSGRIEDWRSIINKNNNIFFGNGVMGDRYLINQSASNYFIYLYASSGLIGLFLGIIFYLKALIISLKTIFVSKLIINKKSYKNIITCGLVLFFLYRGLAETSFALFGIDFIIFFLCYFYLTLNMENKSSS